jgi:hypothetical protein
MVGFLSKVVALEVEGAREGPYERRTWYAWRYAAAKMIAS